MKNRYFQKEIETESREKLEENQLKDLQNTIDRALTTGFYRKKLNDAGITSGKDLKKLSDISGVPITQKDELRSLYPEGLKAVAPEEIIRLHTSSGTTGIPTVIYHNRNDIQSWAELMARSMVAAGAGPEDVFQNMTGYGLFTGGLGMHYGAEFLGMTVIPTGSGNSSRQLRLMNDFRTTIVHATPSYLLHLYDQLEESEYELDDLALKKAFLGAEPYSESTRKKLEALWGIDVYNSYGLSEMNGPGVSFECEYKNGMHTWEDAFLLETLDPENHQPVPEGESGELVFTTLKREATPLLRYRTRDISRIIPGVCECGRVHRRIDRISGRTDDMLIINGVNVFPSQIEAVLMKIPEVGTNYQIHLAKDGALDRITVKVEIYSKLFTGDLGQLEEIRSRIRSRLHASIIIHPRVELHEPGSLPVAQGKAVRVVDERGGDS
ncbi:MAG: phenylacetate--CoA ligase [Spirochaetales bacterium]|nr:phenylacetate--CoA ligase [Spirochaetales bacterium]MCF7938035.1 phenylacetate--CoA ligase [Spirochaetales bacterium]